MRRALITILSVVGLSLLGVAEASAQIDLGRALGALLNEAAQTQTTENPYAKIKANAPAKTKVQGTWHYLTARVEYLGINSLAQVQYLSLRPSSWVSLSVTALLRAAAP